MGKNTAMITGAAGGIGRALIQKFAESGYNIIACIRKEQQDIFEFFDKVEDVNGITIYACIYDVTNTDAMKTEIKRVLKEVDTVDVLVNNVGISHGGLFVMTKVDAIREVFEVNLFSHMELTQLVLRSMMRKKSGAIINISSIAGIHPRAGSSAYGASKAALKAWTETLSIECAPYGIRVNAVAPGLTDTTMVEQIKSELKAKRVYASAMERLARPSEIANAVFFLASDQASFVNGHTLIVDGGEK